MSLHHRTQHKMGQQGFVTDKRDEIINVETYPNKMQSRLYISSDDKIDGTYANAEYFCPNSALKNGVSAVGIESVSILWSIPNINGYNNNIIFEIAGDAVYNVSLDIDDYATNTALYTEIIKQLNSPFNPLTPFSFTQNKDSSITLEHDTLGFNFVNCSFINNGDSVHGLFYTSFVSEIISVPYLLYTTYIDLEIDELLSDQIAQSTYSKEEHFQTSHHLARIQTDTLGVFGLPYNIIKEYNHINYVPFTHRDIKDLRLRILDQYNNELWSQSFIDGTLNEFEIKNLKYNIVLNTVF